MEFRYFLYGRAISTDLDLGIPVMAGTESSEAGLRIHENPESVGRYLGACPDMSKAGQWALREVLPAVYFARWQGFYDFLVDVNKNLIEYRAAKGAQPEILRHYLVHQVISIIMLKKGEDPLHGTVLGRGSAAIAFIGDSGYGKSTLASAFLKRGYELVADDLIAFRSSELGINAYPGLPRLKLLADSCGHYLNQDSPLGVAGGKQVVMARNSFFGPRKLQAIISLNSPESSQPELALCRMSETEALLSLVSNCYNTIFRDETRLAQQFLVFKSLVSRCPVYQLSYPRNYEILEKVVMTIEQEVFANARIPALTL